MYEDLVKNNIIIELKYLIQNKPEKTTDIDSYAQFMKETILATYGKN